MIGVERLHLKVRDFHRKILPSNNVNFVHINKTGGSSIEEALKLPREHKTALEIIGRVGRERWNNTPSFCVVRNPWDKVVSHYHYRIQTNQTGMGKNRIGFDDWVHEVYANNNERYLDKPRMFMPQLDWIADGQEVLVDYVIRFEKLGEEFNSLMKELGIEAELPHIKSTKRDKFQQYYNSETNKLVGDWYQKDIQKFSYTFQ